MLRTVLLVTLCFGLTFGASAEDLLEACTTSTDPDAKLESCNKLIESGDRLPIGYMNRGIAYLDKKDYDNAITDFDKAVELNPKLGYAFHKRGIAHIAMDKDDLAIEDFTKAVEADPDSYDAY